MIQVLRVVDKLLRIVEGWRDGMQEQLKKRNCTAGDDVVLAASSRVQNHLGTPNAISIGAHCRILGQLMVFAHGGRIQIGESCFIGEHSRIWSAEAITIGNHVLISHGVNIHDNNSHSVSAAKRREHFIDIFSKGHPEELEDVPSAPVVIEDDAWIGFNSTILKGVTIGRGAIVGACSLVTRDVEPFSVVVGNPARVIGQSTA